MRRGYNIQKEQIKQPVFFAELKSDLKDKISGQNPTITGSMSTFDADKGLYFNGNSGLKWSFSQLAFNPTTIDIDTSYTMLLDFYRDRNAGHDWFLVIGTDTNKQLIAVLMSGSSTPGFRGAIKDVEFPYIKSYYRTLNTQYNNFGITYDGATHEAKTIINGVLTDTCNVTIFPTITSSMYLYIGQSSYNGDKMNGYLKNVRFYLDYFDDTMLI